MRQRLEAETPEQRDARLEHMRTLQQQRLEVETPEQRDARLEHMKTLQQQRLEVETPQEREKMCAPQIDQGYVKGKMNRFHTEMLSIESLLCTTCLEKFPGTKMSVKSPECLRCCRDNKVPKLYSANNNMHCKKKSVQCTPNMVCYVCPNWNTLYGVKSHHILGVCLTPNWVCFHTNSVCFPTNFSVFSHSL